MALRNRKTGKNLILELVRIMQFVCKHDDILCNLKLAKRELEAGEIDLNVPTWVEFSSRQTLREVILELNTIIPNVGVLGDSKGWTAEFNIMSASAKNQRSVKKIEHRMRLLRIIARYYLEAMASEFSPQLIWTMGENPEIQILEMDISQKKMLLERLKKRKQNDSIV